MTPWGRGEETMPYSFILRNAEYLAGAIVIALLLMPIGMYLRTTWKVRRSEIVGALSENGIRLYFKQFYPDYTVATKDLTKAFNDHYALRYGKLHYVPPTILLAATGILLLSLTLHTVFSWLNHAKESVLIIPWVAVSAISGAYMWVVTDLVARCRRRSLAPSDVYLATIRLALAVPLGFAFAAIAKEEMGVPVAFFLGAFPQRTLMSMSRRFATRRLGLSESGEDASSELEQIDGINAGIAERFQGEGITTILQLAYADAIDLSIRSDYSVNFVTSCISQALAWNYLGKDLEMARKYSARGALEIYNLYNDLDQGSGEEKASAEKTLESLSISLKIDKDALRRTFGEIAGDPFTEFISDLWPSGPEPQKPA
jgi:hypothetical protein